MAEGDRFSYQSVLITSATIDIESTRTSRLRSGSFEPELDGDESDVIACDFNYPECSPEPYSQPDTLEFDTSTKKFEEFTRIISLGLFDYLRKSRSRGFVVSLSGGVDSTATVLLCALMVRFAVNELGIKEFCKKTGIQFDEKASVANIVEHLLTTVYQATRNSTDTTKNAAEQIAKAVSANHLFFDVDELVEKYTSMVSDQIGRDLTWIDDDIALQNIQARVRSPGIWMLANIRNALLLSTSNRSEIAVGYATMDGDTSGGLAPIAGIDKHFLQQWLRWMEKEGPRGIGAIPEVRCVIEQQPTAELRPQQYDQTDEADLMPYEILDAIEKYAIRDKLMPLELFKHLIVDYPDLAEEQIAEWIIRFFRLFCRNQWKRERYAPSFHVDYASMDPKTWCRFPILSGGYEYEISQLMDHLNS